MKQPHTEQIHKICFRQLTDYSLTNSIEDKVMLIDDLEKLCFDQSMELDFIALLFCTQGNIELDIHDKRYYVGTNNVLYCNRGTLLHHISLKPGYKGKLLCISWEYAERLLMRGTCSWESILHTRQYPLLHLQSREQQLLKAYYQLFAVKVENYYYTPQHDVDCIFLGFFRDFHQIVVRYAGQWNRLERSCMCSRQDELFKRFMVLLKEHFKQQHSLSFYADSLCVTSKYLTTVVKQISGQSVSKWIDMYLIDEIKSLLRNSNLTISEIASQLHFSNPSFFGKFVKAKTGMSPQSLRKALREA